MRRINSLLFGNFVFDDFASAAFDPIPKDRRTPLLTPIFDVRFILLRTRVVEPLIIISRPIVGFRIGTVTGCSSLPAAVMITGSDFKFVLFFLLRLSRLSRY